MKSLATGVSAVVVLAAVLALPGCSHDESASPESSLPSAPPPPVSVATTPTVPLPAPDALTDVLYRLADPAVAGGEKLNLIEGAKPADAVTLDRFTTALKDNGSLPLTFEADDIAWSDVDPSLATANVKVTTANPDSGGLSFPMEFKPRGDGWQLSQKTAEMLLAFGKARADNSPEATPAP